MSKAKHFSNLLSDYQYAKASILSGASRMRAGQGICDLRQGILGRFRPLSDIFGAKGLLKDTFLFEGRDASPLPPRCFPEVIQINVLI